MYEYLKNKLKINCNGASESPLENMLYKYKGSHNNNPIEVEVTKVSPKRTEFKVVYNNTVHICTNEKDTLKHLTRLFTGEKNGGVFFTNEMKKKAQMRKIINQYEISDIDVDSIDEMKDEVFEDEDIEIKESFEENSDDIINERLKKEKTSKTIKETIKYIEANKIGFYKNEQVGYLDEDMPSVKELESLTDGVKKGISSNYYNGYINRILKESNMSDRYKLVYVKNYYYCYDKGKECLISYNELLRFLKNNNKDDAILKHILNLNGKQATTIKRYKNKEDYDKNGEIEWAKI